MERLHELNPRLVVLSITGFGHDGPEGGRAGYDQIAQGEAGLMSLTGPAPDDADQGRRADRRPAGRDVRRLRRAVAALHERERTGRGTVVRTSLLAAIVGVHAFQGTRYTVAGEVPHGQGNHHPSICPYGLFRCADGMVQIAVGSEALWRRFAAGVRPRRSTPPASPATPTGSATARPSSPPSTRRSPPYPLAELLPRLAEVGIPSGEVRTLDQVYELGPDPVAGPARSRSTTRSPARSSCPARRCASTAPPRCTTPPRRRLGQHDDSVRAWLDAVDGPSGVPDSLGP